MIAVDARVEDNAFLASNLKYICHINLFADWLILAKKIAKNATELPNSVLPVWKDLQKKKISALNAIKSTAKYAIVSNGVQNALKDSN
jgi:hypothetical protein